jgi:hypothetical protein
MFARSRLPDVDAAVGVLPVDAVLADEHDLVHGDDVRLRLDGISLRFDAGQVIDSGGLAHALLDAWELLSQRRTSLLDGVKVLPTTLSTAADTPFDLVCMYVIGEPPEPISAELRDALKASYNARQAPEGAAGAQLRVAEADRVLASTIVDRLNVLLERRLADEPCFRPLIEDGCVAAVGEESPQTDAYISRLLLEAAFPTQLAKIRDRRLAALYAAVRERETAALCLSGGGIRSATFALGVLRGLARHRLLGKFDYLSTVSGGGYIGSWLTAWMHHAGADEVERELGRPGHEKLQPDPEPVRHLRSYSHYLSPHVGFLSGDTWTLVATLLRNLLLNWLVLVPLLAAAVLAPRFLLSLVRVGYYELDWMGPLAKNIVLSEALVLGVILGIAAVAFVHRHRSGEEPAVGKKGEVRPSQRAFLADCLGPLVASSMMLAGVWYVWWRWSAEAPGLVRLFDFVVDNNAQPIAAVPPSANVASVFEAIREHWSASVTFVALGAFVHTAGWFASGRARKGNWGEAIALISSGIAAGACTLLVAMWFVTRPDNDISDRMYVTLAPPAYLGVILLGSQAFTGWTSRSRTSTDSEREWVARFNAWLLIVIVCWSAGSAVVLFGPQLIHAAWQRVSLALLGGGTGLTTILLGRSPKTTGQGPGGTPTVEGSSPTGALVRRLGLALAAPLFTVSIVIGLAAANESAIQLGCDFPGLANLMRCTATVGDTTPPAQSIALDIVSGTATDQAQTLSRELRSPGADARLHDRMQQLGHDVFTVTSQPDSDQGRERIPAIRAALLTAAPEIADAVARAKEADSAFVTRSATYTIVSHQADSIAMLAGQTDSVLRAHFYHRGKLDTHVSTVVAERIRARDTLALDNDVVLKGLDSVVGRRRGTGDSVSIAALAQIHDSVSSRMASALETDRQVRDDSISRHQSRLAVDSVLRQDEAEEPFDPAVPFEVLLLFAVLLGFALLMGWRIDTNKFSLHGMYYARLVRAYLGASRAACDRNPNPFTGFDPADDLPMRKLWPACAGEGGPDGDKAAGRSETTPPLHVLNLTLNLVGGASLAWQQRKAESFSTTSLHAGSAFVGYRRTSEAGCRTPQELDRLRLFGGPSGITLGTAMTISGAAASPNAGAMSTPLITFLMTLFNARLGSWLGNPGRAGEKTFDQGAPAQKIRPILEEMFGLTSDRSPYVYLSDGGHFENLGLYEMILRRCRFIVVSDAGCDVKCSFEDLGNAVRKIRVDFGVPIEFPNPIEIYARNAAPPGGRTAYWAIGRIRYSAVDMVDGGTEDDYDGILVYLKPAIYGQEPRDVYNYAQVSADFPHESTTDQFFSESQFESYRALGEHVIDELVRLAPDMRAEQTIRGKRTGSLLSQWPNLGVTPPVRPGEGVPASLVGGLRVEPVR